MSLLRLIVIIGLGTVLLAPPIWSWSRLAGAERELTSVQSGFEGLRRQAAELVELRGRRERISDRKRPEEHVLAQVNRLLTHAGIPGRALEGVRPEGDTAIAGSRAGGMSGDAGGSAGEYRRQSVSLSLQALTLTEIGAFLTNWREDNLVWKPTRIDLTKHRSRSDDDDRYSATITISAIYVAEPAS